MEWKEQKDETTSVFPARRFVEIFTTVCDIFLIDLKHTCFSGESHTELLG